MASRRPPPPSLRTPSRAQQKLQAKAQPKKKTVRPPRFVYVGSPEVSKLLVEELGPSARAQGDGIVGADVDRDPVFARQRLAQPVLTRAATRDDLAAEILSVATSDGRSPRVTQVFCPELPREGSARRAAHPLQADVVALQAVLEQKLEGRRAKSKLGPSTAHRLQVLLLGSREALISVDELAGDDPLLAWPSTFPAGRALHEADRDAPSSAWRKLEEALRWLDVAVDAADHAVDLGAAPGGWTRLLRERGARVTAVDRAALDAAVAADPGVVHLKKDALAVDLFALKPTLVVCDVIWEPKSSAAIMRRCIAVPTTRAAVITFKLKSPIDWGTLDEVRSCIRDLPAQWSGRLKHLTANKLEVTLLLRRAAARSSQRPAAAESPPTQL
jgi:23S rRNA C2498 (ribose-2'-O)-methylase RlmM